MLGLDANDDTYWCGKAVRDIRLYAERELALVLQRMSISHGHQAGDFFLLPVCFFGFDVVLCIEKTQFCSRWRAFINYLTSQSSKTDQNLNFPFPVQKSYISFFFLDITKNAMATWRQSFKSLVADGMAASELLGCQLLSLSTRLQPHWICTSQLLLKLWGTGYIFSWSQHGLSSSWNKWGWCSQGVSDLVSGVSPANTASVVGQIVKLLFQNLFVKNIFVASLWHTGSYRHVIFLRSLLAGELEVVQKRKTSSCVTAMHWSVSTTRKQWLPWSGEDSVAAIAATNGSLLHDLFHSTSLSWQLPFAQGGTAGSFSSEKCIMENDIFHHSLADTHCYGFHGLILQLFKHCFASWNKAAHRALQWKLTAASTPAESCGDAEVKHLCTGNPLQLCNPVQSI